MRPAGRAHRFAFASLAAIRGGGGSRSQWVPRAPSARPPLPAPESSGFGRALRYASGSATLRESGVPPYGRGFFCRLPRVGAGFAAGCAYCAPASAGGGLAAAPVVSGALRGAARRARHSLRFASLAARFRCVLASLVRAALPAPIRSRVVRLSTSEVSRKNRSHCGLSLTPAFFENSPSDIDRRKKGNSFLRLRLHLPPHIDSFSTLSIFDVCRESLAKSSNPEI